MRIALDISQVIYQGTGVGRYTKYLIETVTKYDKNNDYVFFLSTLRGILSQETKDLLKNQIVRRAYFPPSVLCFIWNRLHILPIETFVGPVDLVITSDWTEPPVKSARKMTIVHDLVYLKYPETVHPKILDAQKTRMKWVKQESDIIIADSESTRQDLIDLLNIEPTRIKVVYPAIEITMPNLDQIATVRQKYNLTKPFILSVGKLEPRKNIPSLIKAFEKLKRDNIDLLIVGTTGWGNDNSEEVHSPSIKFLGFVPDVDLYALYSQALCFVMPSLYEGFGYPLVEAMQCGCPVVASNVSSMKEIVGDAGLLFDPLSVDDITKSIKNFVDSKELRDKFVKKGKERAKDFTLKKFAEDFIKILSKLN